MVSSLHSWLWFLLGLYSLSYSLVFLTENTRRLFYLCTGEGLWLMSSREYRRQTACPTFLPLYCLPSSPAKCFCFLRHDFHLSLVPPFYYTPTPCLYPMFPWASLTFSYLLVSWTSLRSVWCQQYKAVASWAVTGSRISAELQGGTFCDHWGPRDYPRFLKYTQQTWSGYQNLLKWRFRPKPRTF